MMNKIILTCFIPLLLLPFVAAYYEGQIVTQSQIDNFPLNEYTTLSSLVNLFSCKLDAAYKNNGWYHTPFYCFNLMPYNMNKEEKEYIIINQTYRPKIHIQSYRDCVAVYNSVGMSKSECVTEFKGQLKGYAKNMIWKQRKQIIRFQTPDDTGFNEDDFSSGLW